MIDGRRKMYVAKSNYITSFMLKKLKGLFV